MNWPPRRSELKLKLKLNFQLSTFNFQLSTLVDPRLEQYLALHGLTARRDDRRAADRRRLRSPLLPRPDEGRQADRPGPAPGADRVRDDAVRRGGRACCSRSRCRCRRILHHSDELGVLGLEDLGDVTLQAHLGAATAGRACRALSPGGLVHRPHAAARRGAAVAGLSAVSDCVRRREADLGARVLRQALPARLQGRGARATPQREALRARVVGHRRGAGRRAARAVPSRLSQPQPDAARRLALHHRLPGRADGARHLRPGVAAARFVRRPDRRRRSTS